MYLSAETNELKKIFDRDRDLFSWDPFKRREEMKMLIGSEFLPKYIKLGTQTYVLTNFVDLVYASTIYDDLGLLRLIGCYHSRKYVDESSLTCTVVTQHSHQFSWLDLDCQLV